MQSSPARRMRASAADRAVRWSLLSGCPVPATTHTGRYTTPQAVREAPPARSRWSADGRYGGSPEGQTVTRAVPPSGALDGSSVITGRGQPIRSICARCRPDLHERAHSPRRAWLLLHWAISGCGIPVRHRTGLHARSQGWLLRVLSSGRCADPRRQTAKAGPALAWRVAFDQTPPGVTVGYLPGGASRRFRGRA
jgi:hypothetical protein